MERFEGVFGSLINYVGRGDQKTPCLFIREENGKAVVFFEHAEFAARVGFHQLEKIKCV